MDTSIPSEFALQQVYKLRNDARVTRQAHFLAKERKKFFYLLFGIGGILFNVIIAAGLFDAITPNNATFFIKASAIIAGALAATQTLFNFQKEVELHSLAGDAYSEIYRRILLLIAEFKDGVIDENKLVEEYKKLMDWYFEINKDNRNSIPSNKDFNKARKSLNLPRQVDPSINNIPFRSEKEGDKK